MFLKNKNTIFKIRRSKVTDYAALSEKEDKDLSIYLFIIPNPRIKYYWNVTCAFRVSKKD